MGMRISSTLLVLLSKWSIDVRRRGREGVVCCVSSVQWIRCGARFGIMFGVAGMVWVVLVMVVSSVVVVAVIMVSMIVVVVGVLWSLALGVRE